MPYASLLVNIRLGRLNRDLLTVVADLAARLGSSKVIGVAACRPIQAICADYAVPAKLFEEDRKHTATAFELAEAEFRSIFGGRTLQQEWRARTTLRPLSHQLVREARSADLLVTRVPASSSSLDTTRDVDIRDLVMEAAKPVLIVPEGARKLSLEHVLVGWKDTREAQRALLDALPLLARATTVTLAGIAPHVELAEVGKQIAEVVTWLTLHGIVARSVTTPSRGAFADELTALADELGADLTVTGACGYSRQQEWVLGGVTSDLLTQTKRCSLLSH